MLEKIHKISKKILLPLNVIISILLVVVQFGPGDVNDNLLNFTILFLVVYWILFVLFMLVLVIRSQLEHSKTERFILGFFYILFLVLPITYFFLMKDIAGYLV
jgi:hypothetical protein